MPYCHAGEREVLCVRTRERSYFDYGFKEGEERQLQEFCRRPDFAEDFLLLECAKKANTNIGGDLYFSLIRGLSWEQMDKRTCQQYSKGDFYGYRRKALGLFREALIECGRYPF